MMSARVRSAVVGGLALVLTAGFVLFAPNIFSDSREPLTLMPEKVEFVRDVLENETVSVNLQLKNGGKRPVTVTKALKSCGCMTLVTTGGQEPDLPIVVGPGESIPWELKLNMANTMGDTTFKVVMEGSIGNRTLQTESEIIVNILPGWRTAPSLLVFEDLERGQSVRHDVAVFDGYPDPGVNLVRAIASSPDRMIVKVVPAGELPLEGWTADDYVPEPSNDSPLLKLRYVLQVSCPAEKQPIDSLETITLKTDHPLVEDLSIPVAIRRKKPKYRLLPEALTVHFAGREERVVRKLQLIVTDSVPPNIRDVTAPDFVNVEVGQSIGNVRELKLEISRPQGEEPDPIIVEFAVEDADGQEERRLQLPIHIRDGFPDLQ